MEKQEVKEKNRVTTLGELANTLPIIPLDSEGKPVKDRTFNFIEWDMEIEEKLSDIQKKTKNVGTFMNKMMSLLLDTYCGLEFHSLTEDKKLMALNNIDFANMMYMYMFLRTEELGYDLKMDVGCPNCSKLIRNFVADLSTLEVHAKDEEHDREIKYELHKAINSGDDVITTLTIDHSKWHCMEGADLETSENAGKMKKLLFNASVTKVSTAKADDKKFHHVGEVIKKLKKFDIEKLSGLVTENNAGPMMSMRGECPHCDREFFKPLDWNYRYFFDSSSL